MPGRALPTRPALRASPTHPSVPPGSLTQHQPGHVGRQQHGPRRSGARAAAAPRAQPAAPPPRRRRGNSASQRRARPLPPEPAAAAHPLPGPPAPLLPRVSPAPGGAAERGCVRPAQVRRRARARVRPRVLRGGSRAAGSGGGPGLPGAGAAARRCVRLCRAPRSTSASSSRPIVVFGAPALPCVISVAGESGCHVVLGKMGNQLEEYVGSFLGIFHCRCCGC